MTHVPEIGTRKPVPVFGTSDMQFVTYFFCYRFSITNSTSFLVGLQVSAPIYGTCVISISADSQGSCGGWIGDIVIMSRGSDYDH